MARVFGEAGGYAQNRAHNLRMKFIQLSLASVGAVGLTLGLAGAAYLPSARLHPLVYSLVLWVVALALWHLHRRVLPRMDQIERERLRYVAGATGADRVAWLLDNLSDQHFVLHDVPTPTGNLDHVVIGPQGVFVIETKNWRGVVTADGSGELRLNGQPAERPYLRQLVRRTTEAREALRHYPFEFHCVFQTVCVFTSASVNVPPGSTDYVYCLRDDELMDYLLDEDGRQLLNQRMISGLADVFSAYQREFPAKATGTPDSSAATPSLSPALPALARG